MTAGWCISRTRRSQRRGPGQAPATATSFFSEWPSIRRQLPAKQMCASTASVRVRPPSPDQCRRGGTGRRTRSRAWRPRGQCEFDSRRRYHINALVGEMANPLRSDRREPKGKCAFESRRGYQQHPLLVEQEVTAASNAVAVKASRFDSGGADHTHRRQAHTDEHAPDKREAASANLAPATTALALRPTAGPPPYKQQMGVRFPQRQPVDVREHVQRCAPLITGR